MRDAENVPRGQFPPDDRSGRPDSDGIDPPVNERPYHRFPESAEVIRTMVRPAERGRDEEESGYVIHLPVRVPDLATATALAATVAISLGFLRELDAGETTVSTADDQNNRHRVFCDLLLPGHGRCPQRYDHEGPCGEEPATPEQRPAPRPT